MCIRDRHSPTADGTSSEIHLASYLWRGSLIRVGGAHEASVVQNTTSGVQGATRPVRTARWLEGGPFRSIGRGGRKTRGARKQPSVTAGQKDHSARVHEHRVGKGLQQTNTATEQYCASPQQSVCRVCVCVCVCVCVGVCVCVCECVSVCALVCCVHTHTHTQVSVFHSLVS